jgi:Protein of unknown function (DUF541)
VQNPGPLEAEASAKAVANAHAIAEQIAQKSGVHLGPLVSTSENPGAVSSPINGVLAGFGGGMGAGYGGGAYDTITIANRQLAINSRRVEFQITVYAVFSIE